MHRNYHHRHHFRNKITITVVILIHPCSLSSSSSWSSPSSDSALQSSALSPTNRHHRHPRHYVTIINVTIITIIGNANMSINIFRKNSKNTNNVTIHLTCGIIIAEIKKLRNHLSGSELWADLPDPVTIRIPIGSMVAFRGDYVHGGTFYDLNHTRIFMGLTMIEDVDINTTHLEDTKKTPPSEIKREGKNAEVDVAGSRGIVVTGKKKKKRKAV
jgi:hypothetical protein